MSVRSRAADTRARAKAYAERVEASRQAHGSVDAAFRIFDRDSEIGGGLMAGSLAYRLFIWLLPFALVIVGGIGFAAGAADETPASAARSLGLRGVIASSVAEASRGTSRWYAIAIGIPILIWASRGLLRALVVVHRLVWGDPRHVVPKATLVSTLRFLGMFLLYVLLRELASNVGTWTGSYVLKALVGLVSMFGWWLLVSLQLPHRGTSWQALVPGAILVAVGLELLSDVGAYLIATRVDSSQSAYGVLGVAAGLLFTLFVVSRIVVAAAVVNVTIWDGRRRPD